MRVRTTTSFHHGTQLFEGGREYDVPDDEGHLFAGNGWVESPTGEPLVGNAGQPATLQVHGGVHAAITEEQ